MKSKICEYCVRPLVSGKIELCPLCKKVLCDYHLRPEDHKCERVDWEALESKRQDFNIKRWDDFKEKRFYMHYGKKLAWIILFLIFLRFLIIIFFNK